MKLYSSVLSSLIFVLFFSTFPVLSEQSVHNDSTEKDLVGKKKRPPVTDKLSEEELAFLVDSFFRVDSSIQERFDNKGKHPDLFIPEGITALQKEPTSETVLAKALAELSGSLNEAQLEFLQKESKKLSSSIRDQDPKDRDGRLLALAERSEWITYIFAGETPPSDSLPQAKDEKAFQAFKKEFLAALKTVNQKNKDLLGLIEEARRGNETAKKNLRSALDLKSLPTFLKAQNDFGGSQLFEHTAEAVAQINPEGIRYHDFKDGEGRTARVVVGKTPQEHAQNLSRFFKDSPERLGGYSFVSRPFSSGNPELINLTGKPVNVSPPAAGAGTSSATVESPLAKAARPIFQSKCAACHKGKGMPIFNFSEAADLVELGEMPKPPAPPLSPQEKSALIRFFRSGESKGDFTRMTQ